MRASKRTIKETAVVAAARKVGLRVFLTDIFMDPTAFPLPAQSKPRAP